MLNDQWIFFGAGLNIVAGALYIHAVLQGRARPSRVTWLVSGTAGWIAVISQIGQGVGLPAVLAGVVAVVPTLILGASFIQRGSTWTTTLDRVCLAAALCGVGVLLTVSGAAAIVAAMVVHALGAIPTLRKAYLQPESEAHVAFTAGMLNATLTLGTLDEFTFAAAAFPLYFLAMCGTISFLIVVRPRLVRILTALHVALRSSPPAPPGPTPAVAIAALLEDWEAFDPAAAAQWRTALAQYLPHAPEWQRHWIHELLTREAITSPAGHLVVAAALQPVGGGASGRGGGQVGGDVGVPSPRSAPDLHAVQPITRPASR